MKILTRLFASQILTGQENVHHYTAKLFIVPLSYHLDFTEHTQL